MIGCDWKGCCEERMWRSRGSFGETQIDLPGYFGESVDLRGAAETQISSACCPCLLSVVGGRDLEQNEGVNLGRAVLKSDKRS